MILSGLHADTIIGGRGDDYLDAGRDKYADNAGSISFNLVVGMQGNDELIGSDAKDVMFGDGFMLGIDDDDQLGVRSERGKDLDSRPPD